jgi:uncharacterized protein YcbK (DUF882 family)
MKYYYLLIFVPFFLLLIFYKKVKAMINFKLSDYLVTDYPSLQDSPTARIKRNLKRLHIHITSKIPDSFKIQRNSGYRSSALNTKVGGSVTSDHMKGKSQDITDLNGNTSGLYDWLNNNVDFDQLIYYKNKNFVHVSYRSESENRNQSWVKS